MILTAPNLTLKTTTGEKTKIQAKLDASIECGSRKFQLRVYVDDITDSCILGMGFLQKFKFTVDWRRKRYRQARRKFLCFQSIHSIAKESRMERMFSLDDSVLRAANDI
ncbi:hypothetical protein AVEN_16067-1 [Araneus ventricosus]|uniref:Uncharacterized protein n=1 Tax=Araneus ventricosus TaxID=182803 RepID=A0A4Y2USN0_ARAVE|nr:hypothetical protein AVEN_16067-1 [Araneus ventricosus]